jgi:hypothetical protein
MENWEGGWKRVREGGKRKIRICDCMSPFENAKFSLFVFNFFFIEEKFSSFM